MKVAIMQPYFFPYIGYFQLINAVDIFIIYDDVQYIERGWVNRNRILGGNGPIWLTFPVRSAPRNNLINERFYVSENGILDRIFKSVSGIYNKSPFFRDFFPIFRENLCRNCYNVAYLNSKSLMEISNKIGIETQFLMASDFDLDRSLSGQKRILELCRRVNATTYINPIGGVSLYGDQEFARQGIELKFIEPRAKPYSQFGHDFHPWLSIIDMLMFIGFHGVEDRLHTYALLDAVAASTATCA